MLTVQYYTLKRCGIVFLAALLLAAVANGTQALGNLGFHLGLYHRDRETKAIEKAVADYNRISAAFYNSGGDRAGLDEIPAGPFMKRRLFQDINVLENDGIVLVFDKDRFETVKVTFYDRETAVLDAQEVWAVMFQDKATRKPLSAVKASVVKTRYLVHKEMHRTAGYSWIVQECDVYARDEAIPQRSLKPVL